jgi:hypothetical protein
VDKRCYERLVLNKRYQLIPEHNFWQCEIGIIIKMRHAVKKPRCTEINLEEIVEWLNFSTDPQAKTFSAIFQELLAQRAVLSGVLESDIQNHRQLSCTFYTSSKSGIVRQLGELCSKNIKELILSP